MDFTETLYGRANTVRVQKCLFNKWVRCDVPDEATLLRLLHSWDGKYNLSFRTIKSLLSLYGRYAKFKGQVVDTKRFLRLIERREQRREIKAFTRDDARAIIELLPQSAKTAAMFAYHAGLRRGEIYGLTWEDIPLGPTKHKLYVNSFGTIYVKRSYNGPTKNGRSRKVSVSSELDNYLIPLYPGSAHLKERILKRSEDPNLHIKAACVKLGVPVGTLHTFRHTFATLALEAGRSAKQVQEALGHSNVSITLDIYWQNIKGNLELGFC